MREEKVCHAPAKGEADDVRAHWFARLSMSAAKTVSSVRQGLPRNNSVVPVSGEIRSQAVEVASESRHVVLLPRGNDSSPGTSRTRSEAVVPSTC
jgi:hypothetical protein